jgi:uncharacterized SAM-binding protein YcdF (DUF218 family)
LHLKEAEDEIMEDRLLSPPKLAFIIGTRVALGVGIGLLVSRRLTDQARLGAGTALALLGLLSTIPAARFILKGKAPAQLLPAL